MNNLRGLKKSTWLLTFTAAVLLSGGVIFSLHHFVSAQSASQGLEVSPPSQEVSIDPGKTVTIKATIRNKGNSSLPMQVRVDDFTAKGDQGQVELSSNSPYSVTSWTNVTPNSFRLAPGDSQEVTATIKAPADAAGGRYGSFIFSVKPETPEAGAASVSQEIASLFLVKVSGPVDEKLSIASLHAPSFSEFGPITFDIGFKNAGNVHVKSFGLVNVTDMFGNKVADIVVPGTNIFPQADRIVKAQLNKQFLFGKYKATALMYYGSQNQNLSYSTTFFVFPVRIAAAILVVLVLLYLMRKRLKKASKALFK